MNEFITLALSSTRVFIINSFKEKCSKSQGNRKITPNYELTSYHQDVINNLESIHNALLRMNCSIQAEGGFRIIKQDRRYKRIVRRGLDSVKFEICLISIGHNLYKYYNKPNRINNTIS